jgi:hypothetical protein
MQAEKDFIYAQYTVMTQKEEPEGQAANSGFPLRAAGVVFGLVRCAHCRRSNHSSLLVSISLPLSMAEGGSVVSQDGKHKIKIVIGPCGS